MDVPSPSSGGNTTTSRGCSRGGGGGGSGGTRKERMPAIARCVGPMVALFLLLCTVWATVIVHHSHNQHDGASAGTPTRGYHHHDAVVVESTAEFPPSSSQQQRQRRMSNRKLVAEASTATATKKAKKRDEGAAVMAGALAQRARERRERTRPPVPPVPVPPPSDAPPLPGGISFHLPSYDPPPRTTVDDGGKGAGGVTGPALCGGFAISASARHPRHYLTDALNSTSRVLISGIVSNPMGVHLAHTLHRLCNVSQIVGVDSMLPNTLRRRMDVIDGPLAVLARDVPGFRLAPPSFVGVRSREDLGDVASWDDARIRTLMRSNGEEAEWDVMEQLDPTHVVHLASYRGDVIAERGRADLGNVDGLSPYGDRPPFYQWRQGLVSMEQLLRYLCLRSTTKGGGKGGKTRRRRSPHFTYASSDRVYGDAPLGNGEESRGERRRLASDGAIDDGEKKERKKEEKKPEAKKEDAAAAAKKTKGQRLEFVEEGRTLVSPPTSLYGASALADEILASTYAALHGVDSVGLRLASVYGPFASPGADLHDMAERAVRSDDVPIIPPPPAGGDVDDGDDGADHRTGTDAVVDLLYVDDAVDAVIAAMQFRPPPPPAPSDSYSRGVAASASVTIFNVGSGGDSLASLEEVAVAMEGSFPRSTREAGVESRLREKGPDSSRRTGVAAVASVDRARDFLGLFAAPAGTKTTATATSLEVGLTKTVLWHHQRDQPGGVPLERPATFGRDGGPDLSLAVSKAVDPASIPCASECSVSGEAGVGAVCGSSPYDGVLDIVRNLTGSCKYVMYTVNLDPNVRDLHGSEVSTDESKEAKVCKLAFLARTSCLVSELVEADSNKPDGDEGKKTNKKKEPPTEEYFAENNGRLKHSAWTVVWLGDTGSPRDTATMIKIAPGSLFAPNVQKAMYVSPTKDKIPPTSAFLTIVQSADFGGKPPKKKWVGEPPYRRKIIYPPQEPRRSVMFLPEPIAAGFDNPEAPEVGMSTMAYMLSDIDMMAAEPPALARQRGLYDMVPGILNNEELRSVHERVGSGDGRREVKYQRTFSQWIIHDMTLEESRRLRCDWYREYRFWHGGGDNGDAGQHEFTAEDMSLMYVLARRAAQARHSDKCDQWISVLDQDKNSNSKSKADEYWYLDYGGDRCREYGNHVRDGDGRRIFVRLIEKDVTSFLQKRLGDMKGLLDETHAGGDVKYGDDANEEEEKIVGKNEDEEESDDEEDEDEEGEDIEDADADVDRGGSDDETN